MIRNIARENTLFDYELNSFRHGPIVDVSSGGDISGIPNADHPWANFVY